MMDGELALGPGGSDGFISSGERRHSKKVAQPVQRPGGGKANGRSRGVRPTSLSWKVQFGVGILGSVLKILPPLGGL